jgi:hypothetical protein
MLLKRLLLTPATPTVIDGLTMKSSIAISIFFNRISRLSRELLQKMILQLLQSGLRQSCIVNFPLSSFIHLKERFG